VSARWELSEPDAKPSVRAQRRQDMRGRLFRAASTLFAEAGFEETTYDDIAR
jgi:AcrR family transcriptional regulator